MALILDTMTPGGVTANYTRLVRFNTGVPENTTECYCAVYLSKAARQAGAAPLDVRKYVWADADNPLNPQSYPVSGNKNPQQAIYLYLKTLPDYAGAVDD